MILALVAILALYYFLNRRIEPIQDLSPHTETQEEITARQIAELDSLRKDAKPLSQEEIKKQSEELNKLRKKTAPLTQEEINRQMEELDKLRSQNNK